MTTPIGPGDLVRCVDAAPMLSIPTGLIVGRLYVVEAVTPPRPGYVPGIQVRGARHPGNDLGDYNPKRFVPVDRGPGATIADLLQSTPVDDLVTA